MKSNSFRNLLSCRHLSLTRSIAKKAFSNNFATVFFHWTQRSYRKYTDSDNAHTNTFVHFRNVTSKRAFSIKSEDFRSTLLEKIWTSKQKKAPSCVLDLCTVIKDTKYQEKLEIKILHMCNYSTSENCSVSRCAPAAATLSMTTYTSGERNGPFGLKLLWIHDPITSL